MTAGNPFWKNKVVLITGAASGIGLGLATEMIRRGAIVWLADISPAVSEAAAGLGERARFVRLNVADYTEWEEAVRQVREKDGELDLLFNNAGIGFGCDSAELTREHYDRYIDVNIRGVTNGIALVYPMMARRGHGTIVNTASMGGLIPSPIMSPYAMTKHAVVGLSESLRQEARYKGVKVITVCPGSVNTPIFDSKGIDGLPQTKFTDLRSFAREKDTSITPEQHAVYVLDDIEKNKTLIMYPRLMRLIVWIYRYFPGLYHRLTEKNLEGEIERLGSGE